MLSKSYGLAGLRIGWLATRNRAIRAAAVRVKDYGSMCNAAPAEILGVIALRGAGRILDRNRALVLDNVALVDDLIARHPDRLQWHRPRAGAIGFPRLLGDEPVDDFCARLRDEQGVLLLPGTVYGHARNHFRIGFGRRRHAGGARPPGRLPADGVASAGWPPRASRSAAAGAA